MRIELIIMKTIVQKRQKAQRYQYTDSYIIEPLDIFGTLDRQISVRLVELIHLHALKATYFWKNLPTFSL